MARRLRRWKTILLALLSGALSAALALLGFGRAAAQTGPGAAEPGTRDDAAGSKVADMHWTAVPEDTDGDYLGDFEEMDLGTDPGDRDQNGNRLVDGPDWAFHYHAILESLTSIEPGQPSPGGIYRVENQTWGLETCLVCGAEVNMGYALVVNEPAGMEMPVPYIAIHTLGHGGLTYRGSVHEDRLDAARLMRTLRDIHAVLRPVDFDRDYLTNTEETALRTDPLDSDENGNWEPDGMDLARELAARVEALPEGPLPHAVYRIEHTVYGIEACAFCGEEVNMGYVEVVNPVRGTSIELPYVCLHAMTCGAFDYDGTVHSGRVDMVHLKNVLTLLQTKR